MSKKISPRGSSWDELEKELFTPEEIAESDARVAIINELIKVREENEKKELQILNFRQRIIERRNSI